MPGTAPLARALAAGEKPDDRVALLRRKVQVS